MSTYGKQTEDDLLNLVNHEHFQAQIRDRAFQIFLDEDLPEYWTLQFNLLVALKFVFDHVRPAEVTVVFPSLAFRYPSGDIKVLLKLMDIQHVYDGVQIWIEHLVHQGSVQIESSEWQDAFRLTPQGYRIVLTKGRGNYTSLPTTPLRHSVGDCRRQACAEMTKAIENAFNKRKLTQDASDEELKDLVSKKARDLLPQYMEPLPLGFAIRNYKSLMETSYNARTRIRLNDVALHIITDAKESLASGFSSKVKVVIVKRTTLQTHADIFLQVKRECQNFERNDIQNLASYRVCFAGLPGTALSDSWRKLNNQRSGDRSFCEYVELPIHVDRISLCGLLLSLVV
jgi:hypothetical protein